MSPLSTAALLGFPSGIFRAPYDRSDFRHLERGEVPERSRLSSGYWRFFRFRLLISRMHMAIIWAGVRDFRSSFESPRPPFFISYPFRPLVVILQVKYNGGVLSDPGSSPLLFVSTPFLFSPVCCFFSSGDSLFPRSPIRFLEASPGWSKIIPPSSPRSLV